MGPQDPESVYRRLVDEVINGGNVATFDDLTTPDFVEHEELPPGIPKNREGVKQFFSLLHTAFPDARATVENLVVQGDMVAARLVVTGTHRGDFAGIPPTGKQVSIQVFDLVRVIDGKMTEHWGLSDQFSLLQQLGAIPAPG